MNHSMTDGSDFVRFETAALEPIEHVAGRIGVVKFCDVVPTLLCQELVLCIERGKARRGVEVFNLPVQLQSKGIRFNPKDGEFQAR